MTDKNEMTYEEYILKALSTFKDVISTIDLKLEVMQKEFAMGYQEPVYLKTNLVIARDSFERIAEKIISDLDGLIEQEKEEEKGVEKVPVKEEPVKQEVKEKPKVTKPVLDEFDDEDIDLNFEED